MKYTIPENRLNGLIISMFDADLTPHEGWMSPKYYKEFLRGKKSPIESKKYLGGQKYYFFYDKNNNSHEDTDTVMDYDKEDKNVELPDELYGKYNGLFNDLWEPLFLNWFNKKTGLPIKQVIFKGYE